MNPWASRAGASQTRVWSCFGLQLDVDTMQLQGVKPGSAAARIENIAQCVGKVIYKVNSRRGGKCTLERGRVLQIPGEGDPQ